MVSVPVASFHFFPLSMSCTKSKAFESLRCVYADVPPPIAFGELGAFPAEASVPILGDEGGDAAKPIPGPI